MIYFSHLNKIIQRNERAFPLSSRIYSAQLQPDKQTVSHSNICSPTTLLYARFSFARFRLHCVLCCPLNYAIPCGRFTPQKISRRIFLGICVFLNDSKLVFGRKTAHGVSPQPKHCTVVPQKPRDFGVVRDDTKVLDAVRAMHSVVHSTFVLSIYDPPKWTMV